MAKINCLPDRKIVDCAPTQTILEALLADDIPHAHACGGQAYCSTCRIMILDGVDECSPITYAEQALAKKLDFPVHIRLACQTKVSGNVAIRRLVIDRDDIDIVDHQLSTGLIGSPKAVAILFANIRGNTNFDEVNFPYDVAYIMTRYFHQMNRIIKKYGGVTNNYMGVRLIAQFGVEAPQQAAERAVWAGLEMLKAVKELNDYLAQLSYQPLYLTIGIHYGSAVLVAVDPDKPNYLSAIGNVISQVGWIEALNQDMNTELLVSDAVYQQIQEKAVINRHRTLKLADQATEVKVIEVMNMQGEPPAKIQLAGEPISLSQKIVSFIQKFSNSWGKSKS